MAILNIPTSQTFPKYDQRVVLDEREYVLAFEWNQREAKWYLSIFDAQSDPIQQGIKVVANYFLLKKITDERRPPGELIAATIDGVDPGLTDFGTRVVLHYLDAAELAAA